MKDKDISKETYEILTLMEKTRDSEEITSAVDRIMSRCSFMLGYFRGRLMKLESENKELRKKLGEQ